MALTKLSNITLAQASGEFHERLSAIPQVWQNHVQMLPADTKTMTYSFPGFLPEPREFLNSRQVQGMMDFTFTVANNTYELTLLIDRETLEDDQTGGTLMSRMREMAEVWGTYKDSLFASLLENGDTSGNNGWDGTTFYASTRTIGASANIDNLNSTAAATGTVPTATELLTELQAVREAMWKFQDDQGRPSFNGAAIGTKPRVIIPPEYDRTFREAINSTLIGASNADPGQLSNPYGNGLVDFDVLPYLTGSNEMYTNLVGGERKPFIYSERSPLELVFRNEPGEVAENNGVLVLTRQRFVLAYGEPRRSIQTTWT